MRLFLHCGTAMMQGQGFKRSHLLLVAFTVAFMISADLTLRAKIQKAALLDEFGDNTNIFAQQQPNLVPVRNNGQSVISARLNHRWQLDDYNSVALRRLVNLAFRQNRVVIKDERWQPRRRSQSPLRRIDKKRRRRRRRRRQKIAIVVLQCQRGKAISQLIDALLALDRRGLRRSRQSFSVIVSQCCGPPDDFLRSHNDEVIVINSYHTVSPSMMQTGQGALLHNIIDLSTSYAWTLNKTFLYFHFDAAIVLEDNLEVSPDFFSYFESLLPILEKDNTLWCISAWNDNGKKKLVSLREADLLFRTDAFPTIAWMISKQTWVRQLMQPWPSSGWHRWIRQYAQAQNRSCVRPQVSRVKMINPAGRNALPYGENNFVDVQLNKQAVDFSQMNLTYLYKENYDLLFAQQVYETPIVKLSSLLSGRFYRQVPYMTPAVRVMYYDEASFLRAVKGLGLASDTIAGVARTAYRGVVTCTYRHIRVYIAPSPLWKCYNVDWSSSTTHL